MTTYPTKLSFSKMDLYEFVTLDSVSASDTLPNFGHLVFKCSFTKQNTFIFSEIVTVMINW